MLETLVSYHQYIVLQTSDRPREVQSDSAVGDRSDDCVVQKRLRLSLGEHLLQVEMISDLSLDQLAHVDHESREILQGVAQFEVTICVGVLDTGGRPGHDG